MLPIWCGTESLYDFLHHLLDLQEAPGRNILNLRFFFVVLGRTARSARGWRILPWALQKSLGIYLVPAREITKHG